MVLTYAIAPCPLGILMAAASERGVVAVSLGDSEAGLKAALRVDFPGAPHRHNDAALAPWTAELLEYLNGRRREFELPLDVPATPFQRAVWDELRRIPYGQTRSYGEIAHALGKPPTASRAVGGACAANPVALLIPCHRAVPAGGGLGGYRWGLDRKRALLDLEARHGALV